MESIFVIIFLVFAFFAIIFGILGSDSYYKEIELEKKYQKFVSLTCLKTLGKGPVLLDEQYQFEASALGFPIKQYAEKRRLCPVVYWNEEKGIFEVIWAKKQALWEHHDVVLCRKIVDSKEKNVKESICLKWHNVHEDGYRLDEEERVSAEDYLALKCYVKEDGEIKLDNYLYEEIYHEQINFE